MAIKLNHTIVPSHDRAKAALEFAALFGLKLSESGSHFSPVQVNDELTLLFDDRDVICPTHYAFLVSDIEFDEILGRIKANNIIFGSTPWTSEDMRLNDWNFGRGFYFKNRDGHLIELMTRREP